MSTSSVDSTPVGRAGVTPAYVTQALIRTDMASQDARVECLDWAPVGHGQAADNFRLGLTYAAGHGPSTLIGKFASEDSASARMGSNGLYLGEVRFYRDLAATLDVRTPRAVAAEGSEGSDEFVLLLEDMAPASSADQLSGCSPDQAAAALEQLALLHSRSWGNRTLAATRWLGKVPAGLRQIADAFDTLLDRLEKAFGDIVPQSDLATLRLLLDHSEAWKRALSRQTSLWHQDFRVDNLLFGAKAGAVPVAVLDWQTVSFGPGVADVSLLLGGSLTTSDRRTHERELVRSYHAALVAHGIQGYTADDCWRDYRCYAVHGVANGISGPVQVKRSARGDEMWRLWIERHARHVEDLDAFSALEAA